MPVVDGNHINYAYIGKDWLNYNFTIVLFHFKGHPMAGSGGALKNMGTAGYSPDIEAGHAVAG